MEHVQKILNFLKLDPYNLGVQILAAIGAIFFIYICFLLRSRNKLNKSIQEYSDNLTRAADEKVFVLKEKQDVIESLQEKEIEITQLTKALNDDQKKNIELEKRLDDANKAILQLNQNNSETSAHLNDEKDQLALELETIKSIIIKKEEELLKNNKNVELLKNQLKQESTETKSFVDQNNNLKKEIERLNKLTNKLNQEMQIEAAELSRLKLEDQKRKKKLEEEGKIKERKIKMAQLKNVVFECFQDIDNPIFKCYQADETRGTYLHVNQVSQLSYVATQAIGGNPLYAKASALFHDLGKTAIFKYFKENWPHNKNLKLETENVSYSFTHRGHMICSHVERGVQIFSELTKKIPNDVNAALDQYGLSLEEKKFVFEECKELLLKSILEHQARAHVRMLYTEALKNGEICTPEDFEYMIGQIPSDKEQGIICMADSCEAAFSSSIHDSEEAVARLITNVVTGRVNSGHMDDSGLTIEDIQNIKDAFIKYLVGVWKTKRPDRMEDKAEDDPSGYNLHETDTEILKKMISRFKQGNEAQKRQVLRYFVELKEKTLGAVNAEELVDDVVDFLNTESSDNILITNGLVVLCEFYKNLAAQIIEDINKNHPIHFGLTEETVDLELMQNSDISAYIEAKATLKENFSKMQRIREIISTNIRKHRLYENLDVYITNWSTHIDNYLSNQSNIPEWINPKTTDLSASKLENVITLPEDFTKFITVKQDKLYIAVNLDIFRSDCKFIYFVVYFNDHDNNPLRDQGGLFCTKDTKQVAVAQSFIIKNSKFFTIKEPPIVLAQSELHLPDTYKKALHARIQVHGIRADDHPVLMFDQVEEFHPHNGNDPK